LAASVDQRTAVVTGGAGAIGGAIVEELGRAGYRTEILDRAQCDLADASDVRRAAAALGGVDVLVHAAATFEQGALSEIDPAPWRRVQAVNVEAALIGLKRMLALELGGAGVTVNAVAPGQTLSVDGGLVLR
jgi:NAD(P)-dependent dehydrogenase (short-subunit alcohol dehydrogenase family)